MTASTGFKRFFWLILGAAISLAGLLTVMHFYREPNCAEQILFKTKRAELVSQMQQALFSGAEAEKSAVLAITDQESQSFADQARAASGQVEQESKALASLLETGGTQDQKELLAQFSRAFAELGRVDDDLLNLAVKNTNLKAYGLAFGPATEALKEMDDALSRIVERGANSTAPEAKRVILLASLAQAAALRMQTLLPPHIAEENNDKMDALEALMTREDQKVRKALDGLSSLVKPTGNADFETVVSSYARLSKIRAQILELSRENTNVRSLHISLNQGRKAMFACQAALTSLEQAIQAEPALDTSCGTPTNPRKI